MTKQASAGVQLHKLTEGTCLLCTPQGNVLFGCPPEILKRILASHLPMPDTVVVPEQAEHFHSSQVSLEFPLYHFLFVQRGLDRGRRYQVVATAPQCEGLGALLRVTVLGPTEEEMLRAGTPPEWARNLARESAYMSLKNPARGGQPWGIPEMINFFPLASGEQCELYPVQDKLPALRLERQGPSRFRALFGEEAYEIDLNVTREQEPNYTIRHEPFDDAAGRFTLTVLGRSNGFDPNDPANGYVLNVDGKVVLWDCPAYMHQHLQAMGLDDGRIDAFILSHVHEDHLDVTESLRDPPFELYTTPEIYYSLLVKLAAVKGCSLEEAKRFHHWHPIRVDQQPMDILGARFTFFHSVHAIPALGARIEKEVGGKRGLLHISGDHLSNESLDAMYKGDGLSRKRYEQMKGLLTGKETLALIDAGGGMIHGDYREYLGFEGRVGFMHTGLIKEELPENMQLVRSGQVLDVLR